MLCCVSLMRGLPADDDPDQNHYPEHDEGDDEKLGPSRHTHYSLSPEGMAWSPVPLDYAG